MLRHWNTLPKEGMDVAFLEVFKFSLDGTLSNLVQWKVSLPIAGGLELDDLQSLLWSSYPRHSMILWSSRMYVYTWLIPPSFSSLSLSFFLVWIHCFLGMFHLMHRGLLKLSPSEWEIDPEGSVCEFTEKKY